MNYLAHIYLARHSDDAMLGALLGDFVKPNSADQFSPATEIEILIHRKVDSFTDSHPLVLNAKQMFEGPSRRYAGILLDVFYDHLLAAHWTRYADTPLDAFIKHFYLALHERAAVLPPRLAHAAPYMIDQDWLGSYRHFDGVQTAIRRMATRLSRNGDVLCAGLDDLNAHYDAIATGFHAFFPQLITYAADLRAQLIPAPRADPER